MEIEFDSEGFAERLREHRTFNGWRQAEVEEWCDLSPGTLAHFESGNRTPGAENVYKLCVGLRLSADRLLGIEKSE